MIPGTLLSRAARTQTTISNPELPIDVRVDSYMSNSGMLRPKHVAFRKAEGQAIPENPATAGLGLTDIVEKMPEVSGVKSDEVDVPAAYVTFYRKGTDQKLGTYLVSLWYTINPFDRETEPKQAVTVDNVATDVALRYKRYYKPYSLYLREFKFDRYTGTQQAKNYSSDLTLIDPERGQHRDVRVSMNEPLRFRGETFYQSSFEKGEKITVLQVVRNPGWLLPYLACVLVSVGLLFHFVLGLSQYMTRLKKRIANEVVTRERPTIFERVLPWGVVGLGGLILLAAAMPRSNSGKMDLASAARIPVVDGGRIKPLDTVARVYLRKISAREEFVGEDNRMHPAIEWLMDVLVSNPETARGPAGKLKVVRIENEQVLSLLGLERREGFRYSLEEIGPKFSDFKKAVARAEAEDGAHKTTPDERVDKFFESGDRDVFARQLLETAERIKAYMKLLVGDGLLTLPPANGLDWRAMGDVQTRAKREAILAVVQARGLNAEDAEKLSEEEGAKLDAEVRQRMFELIRVDPSAVQWLKVTFAYQGGKPEEFSKALAEYREATESGVSRSDRAKADFEVFLNEFAPAYQVIVLYALAGFLAMAGWVAIGFRPLLAEAFQKSAFWLLVITFLVHGFALFARMYLMDRPLVFVTNLYSTAVFIGWAAVGMGLFLERVAPIGLGNLAAAVVGGGTAIIAHNLATSGDTLEMMQAVLDTNFWLATHVTTINLGYSATYIAGVIGILYIWLGLFTPLLSRTVGAGVSGPGSRGDTLGRVFGQLMYGVLCLATLLSFVGTVLGGIWADQSWGRFWGWDPKENGAVLIVIWNALILHARWCGLVKDRGIAVLTLVGNMITTWSYFGTNQLSVGLHNYGFSKTLADGCMITWVGHVVLIGMGMIPLKYWRSFASGSHQQAAAVAIAVPVKLDAPSLPTSAEAAPPFVSAVNGTNGTNGSHPANGKHPKQAKGKKHKKR